MAIKEQGSEMTQDEATKVYFNDVKSNPYIFIDDFMVSLNAEINEGRSYGYTLSKGVIDLKFNGVNDENYISFEINLDIEVQQNGKKVSTFNIYEDVKNIAFASEYKDIDLSPIVSVAPC
ncbi:MAG: hypothetical protein MJ233_03570 [Mycoplasmoidaceae bacterium]|nr:hypothetical protein [Mycoplasmoidaceae bacterium]